MKSLRREYPLSTLLELIGMPRSTYYYHEANPPSDRQAAERPAIVEICEKSQFRYGYRRVADTLRKATGVRIADKTVLKVMREEGPLCRTRRRRKHRSYMGQGGKSSPNLLARDFEAEDPMTKLVTDGTEFKVGGTKLYLSPVVDLYNDEVVAYSLARSPNMKMILEMLAGLGRRAVEIAGACGRGDHQIERAFRRFETVLRQEAGDIARRHGGEAGHAVNGGSGDQRFRRHQLARRYQKDLRAQSSFIAAILHRTDKRARKRAERGCRHIGHIRVAQRHDTIQLLLRFF